METKHVQWKNKTIKSTTPHIVPKDATLVVEDVIRLPEQYDNLLAFVEHSILFQKT